MNKLSRYELAVISFIFGAALTAIPFMWLQEEKEMFKFTSEQQKAFCQKVSER